MPQLDFQCLHFDQLSLSQLYDLMRLRQEVFVVEQNCPYLDADGKDQQCHHLLAYDTGKDLQAYTRLVPKGMSYANYASIGRVLTSAEVRGTGVGKRLMEESLKWAEQLFPGARLKISAQCYLIKFYEHFGFITQGTEYLEDDIPHIGMVLK